MQQLLVVPARPRGLVKRLLAAVSTREGFQISRSENTQLWEPVGGWGLNCCPGFMELWTSSQSLSDPSLRTCMRIVSYVCTCIDQTLQAPRSSPRGLNAFETSSPGLLLGGRTTCQD